MKVSYPVKDQKKARRLKIKKKIQSKIRGSAERPRLSIYKSNTAMYVQLIDDQKGHTLLGISSTVIDNKEEKNKSINMDKVKKLGEQIAEASKKKNIQRIVFDRSGYLYHGKVKALAEIIRVHHIQF